MEKMNETNDLFEYNLKSIDKINQTAFKVNCDVNLKVELTTEYHFWIQLFHNKEFKEEFSSDKPMITIPKQDICQFVNSTYRTHMWEHLKDFSNFPEPGTCPIAAGEYYLKDYIHNGHRFKAFMKPGLIRIDMFVSQDHEDTHITKNGVRIFAKIEEINDS
ncbi:hypothetical protein PVAND_002459 [Polypedilum vanderplanki]|uniref:Uncharacterized protein n=1 Tax=Polypedilum vanderplanki TaxID=319348 RepID=A0A9J6BRQ5_POLVA|nr:hypothetical protein PVAND_002459 [Polypedilum vanderplanki]